ncbi:hypothetical protein [Arthrobacter sp. ISL-30]|uniref:hypothetical protein n=1 Tax=Arthrobacter sp. ISL-30 TaxID=2819109 RepID=UPI001BEB4719|nr:hypothetical protein [Arthrobacter sp. ISL-30]MBT2513477.1 hypothetical protein [Arthrobacter sp. ISL-30]
MKKRILLQHTGLSDNGKSQSLWTGHHCPSSGWWAPVNDDENFHFILEGSIMPSVNGIPMSWKPAVPQSQRA